MKTMRPVPNDPVEVVNSALEFEAEGHRILSDAADQSTDPLSKATFQFLAEQELHHIEAIQSFAESLAGKGQFDVDALGSPLDKAEAGEKIKGLFAQFKPHFQEAVWREEGRFAVYDIALDMERHGYDFYNRASELAKDETAKKFYHFLAGEETRHFEIIQETRDYLKQPDAFLAVEENWMNI